MHGMCTCDTVYMYMYIVLTLNMFSISVSTGPMIVYKLLFDKLVSTPVSKGSLNQVTMGSESALNSTVSETSLLVFTIVRPLNGLPEDVVVKILGRTK